MCWQVFNALIVRTARENKLDVNDRTTAFPQPDLRVGLIPAGSTDCVAMCLHGNNDAVTAALHIALGWFTLSIKAFVLFQILYQFFLFQGTDWMLMCLVFTQSLGLSGSL